MLANLTHKIISFIISILSCCFFVCSFLLLLLLGYNPSCRRPEIFHFQINCYIAMYINDNVQYIVASRPHYAYMHHYCNFSSKGFKLDDL